MAIHDRLYALTEDAIQLDPFDGVGAGIRSGQSLKGLLSGGFRDWFSESATSLIDGTRDLFGEELGIDLDDRLLAPHKRIMAGPQARGQTLIDQVAGQYQEGIKQAVRLWERDQLDDKALAKILEAPLSQARTIANTSLAGIQRAVATDVGKVITQPGEDVMYLYSGPDMDQVIRPYCAALVGKAVEHTKLAATPNGHGLPPTTYCGGYNCRHNLLPISKRYASLSGIEIAQSTDYAAARAGGRRR